MIQVELINKNQPARMIVHQPSSALLRQRYVRVAESRCLLGTPLLTKGSS